MNLLLPLCYALTILFAMLAIWALSNLRQNALPAQFFALTNSTHGVYLLVLVLGLLNNGGATGLARFIEYMVLFVGAGIVYTRGVMPGGWMWRILNDPPRVAWGMALGHGWCAAAVIGFVFFALGGR